jgi:thymidylate synthase
MNSNPHDKAYHGLLQRILDTGFHKLDRTGVGTLGVHGGQARFDLADGFPLLTTKKMAFRAIVVELLWFLAGNTNVRSLNLQKCVIWNGNAYDHYRKVLAPSRNEAVLPQEEWLRKLMEDEAFGAWAGELGDVYGAQWRRWPNGHGGVIDQIAKVVHSLKGNPMSRRHIVSAWNPAELEDVALPPCHVLFQFMVRPLRPDQRLALTVDRSDRQIIAEEYVAAQRAPGSDLHAAFDRAGIMKYQLDCELYQRSADLFLGVPFNIASYSLLLQMMAKETGMVPGEFIHTYGDVHIYDDHLEQVKEQLSRTSYPAPTIRLNPEVKSLFDYKPEDITLEGYQSHPAIKALMAV